MRTPVPQFRFRAVSMELTAHLDERRVDMLVVADDGTTIAIECENDTILKIQRHISQITRECPEIASWNSGGGRSRNTDESGYDAAVSEGWPARSLMASKAALTNVHLSSAPPKITLQ